MCSLFSSIRFTMFSPVATKPYNTSPQSGKNKDKSDYLSQTTATTNVQNLSLPQGGKRRPTNIYVQTAHNTRRQPGKKLLIFSSHMNSLQQPKYIHTGRVSCPTTTIHHIKSSMRVPLCLNPILFLYLKSPIRKSMYMVKHQKIIINPIFVTAKDDISTKWDTI